MTRIVIADDDPGIPVHAAWHHIHVESGPLVRSSYHAHEQADAYKAAAGA